MMSYRRNPFSSAKKRKKKSKSSNEFSSNRKGLLAELDKGSYYDQETLLKLYENTSDKEQPGTSSSTRKLCDISDIQDAILEVERWVIYCRTRETYEKDRCLP